MSFGRSLLAGFLGMLGGLLVNILTDPAIEAITRVHLPRVPVLLVALLVVLVLVSILQALPPQHNETPARLQALLAQHRTELKRLKDRCLNGQNWTASCIEQWQEHQRNIAALKRACHDLLISVPDDPIDTESPPRLGCGLRLTLLIRNATALFAVPLVAFSVTFLAGLGLGYNGQSIAGLLTPLATSAPAPQDTSTPELIALASPQITNSTEPTVIHSLRPTGTAEVTHTLQPVITAVTTALPLKPPSTATSRVTIFPSSTATQTPSASGQKTVPLTSPAPLTTLTLMPLGCVEGQRITNPKPGSAQVRGELVITGSAHLEPFQRYRLEWAPGAMPQEDTFRVIRESSVAVRDATLGVWLTRELPSGEYTLRLTIFRPDGDWFEPRCLIVFTLR